MWHIWSSVEKPVDAVAAVAPHHREAIGLSVLLDDVTKLSVANAGLHWKDNVSNNVSSQTHQISSHIWYIPKWKDMKA